MKLATKRPGKNKKLKVARLELKASRSFHRSEKPGCSVGGRKK